MNFTNSISGIVAALLVCGILAGGCGAGQSPSTTEGAAGPGIAQDVQGDDVIRQPSHEKTPPPSLLRSRQGKGAHPGGSGAVPRASIPAAAGKRSGTVAQQVLGLATSHRGNVRVQKAIQRLLSKATEGQVHVIRESSSQAVVERLLRGVNGQR